MHLNQNLDDPKQPIGYKGRKTLLAKKDQLYLPVPLASVYFIQFSEKVAYAYDKDGHKHVAIGSLNQLEKILPASLFFRVNRACIVNGHWIKAFIPVKNGQVQIKLHPPYSDVLIVSSRKRTSAFKRWADQL